LLKQLKNRFRQTASFINRDKPALLTFLFHSVFQNEQEIALKYIDPQQFITVDLYREFLEYFLAAGYTFISPDDLQDLDPNDRYILATFDDGYFNNQHIVPLLQEYKCPAVFYIATNNVLNNHCFWWDVVYRELSQQGLDRKAISTVQKQYKKLNHPEIISKLISEFGEKALQPQSDIDRPFTPQELQDFAAQDYVYIGNHTSDHYILDHYPADIQRQQMQECQDDLQQILQLNANTIAYPNGNYNTDTLHIAAELGFDYGITVDKRKNYLPLNEQDKLRLGRFVLWGNQSLKMQCDIFRSDMTKNKRPKGTML